ncbi:hypothetical protein H5410_025489 [Solanum commersonii]|uniref:Carboxypeptidase A inhibitor-like domain-containing protein n=1 Tax=Solanum commersonii TaxID=4109 RepID=A0A9J5YVX8_SOLCO|nr:hypothetical protein H5410_025489 [Solanum commersonii]
MAQVNKFVIFFVLLLAIAIVDMSGSSKLQVMASCSDRCSSNSDCTGFTLCRFCFQRTNPFDDTKYSECGFLP